LTHQEVTLLSPNDLAPVANILRVGIGFGLFWLVIKPENNTAYRRRFWTTVIVIAGIAATGLRPYLQLGTDTWPGFASLFQFIFNVALVGLLLLRYRLHMPHDGEAPPEASLQ
jgi:hypothetical protein